MKTKLLFILLFCSSLLFSQELIQYKNNNSITHVSINTVNSTYNLSYVDRVEVRSITTNEVLNTFPIEQLSGFYGVGNSVADNEGNVWIQDRNSLYRYNGVSLTLMDTLNGVSGANIVSIETTAQGKLLAVFSNFIGVFENGNWIFSDIYQTNKKFDKNKEIYLFWSASALKKDIIIYSNGSFRTIETTLTINIADIDENNDIYLAGLENVNNRVHVYGKIDDATGTFEAFDYPSSVIGSVTHMKVAGDIMYLSSRENGSSRITFFDIPEASVQKTAILNSDEGLLDVFLTDSQNRLWFVKHNLSTNVTSVDRASDDDGAISRTIVNLPEADGFGKSFQMINDKLYYLTTFELKYIDTTDGLLKTEVSYPHIIADYKELNNEFWFATSNGIIRRNNSVDVFTDEVEGDVPPFANTITKDNNNNVYVAGFSGISKFDGVEWNTLELSSSINTQTIYDLLFDTNDTMWFITDKALYDFSSGVLTEHPYPNSFKTIGPRKFSYDGSNLFLSTQQIIYKYTLNNNTWAPIDIGTLNLQITDLVSDGNNRTWVGSTTLNIFSPINAGLFEIQNNTLVRVDNPFIEDATNKERLKAISEDNSGVLWLNYDPGISTFDGTTFTNHFSYSDIPSSPARSLFSGNISFINNIPYVLFGFDGLFSFQNLEFDKVLDYAQNFRAATYSSLEINNELWFIHFPNGIISRALQSTLSLDELNVVAKKVTVFPNPVKKDETLNFSKNMINANYSIHDFLGRVVNSGKISNNNTIDTSKLNKGIYVLNITKLDSSQTFKIVVN